MKNIFSTIILLSLSLLLSSSLSAKEIYLYRNVQNQELITLDISRRIFEGNKSSWDNGTQIVLLIDKLDEVDAKVFQSFANLTPAQFISRWRIKFFSGRGLIPLQVQNMSSALESLQNNESSIFFTFKEVPEIIFAPVKSVIKKEVITY